MKKVNWIGCLSLLAVLLSIGSGLASAASALNAPDSAGTFHYTVQPGDSASSAVGVHSIGVPFSCDEPVEVALLLQRQRRRGRGMLGHASSLPCPTR